MLDYDRAVIDDPRVKIQVVSAAEALPVSPYDDHAEGYNIIKSTIEQVYHDDKVAVVPGMIYNYTCSMMQTSYIDHIEHIRENLFIL